MAFVRSNFGVVTQSASKDQKFSIWLYKTTDSTSAVTTAGYFGEVVPEGVVNERDLVYVIASNGVLLGSVTNASSAGNIVVTAL